MFQDAWAQMITQPGGADLLMLFSAIGIYLLILARSVNPPANDRLRGLGIIVTGFSLGNILLAVIFNVGLNFQCLETPYVQSAFTSTAERQGDSPKPGLTKPRINADSRHPQGVLAKKRASAQEDLSEQIWKTLKIWEGYDPQQTEIFNVPSHRWAIDWITAPNAGGPGNFAVKVYSADRNLVKLITNERGRDKGSISLNRAGKYYLMITSTQKYKVAVKVTN